MIKTNAFLLQDVWLTKMATPYISLHSNNGSNTCLLLYKSKREKYRNNKQISIKICNAYLIKKKKKYSSDKQSLFILSSRRLVYSIRVGLFISFQFSCKYLWFHKYLLCYYGYVMLMCGYKNKNNITGKRIKLVKDDYSQAGVPLGWRHMLESYVRGRLCCFIWDCVEFKNVLEMAW